MLNVIYKGITKVLAHKLQSVLPSIINQSQSAFVKGSIADNILLMQELVRNYHRDNTPARCAIKIDLRKVYDCRLFKLCNQVGGDMCWQVSIVINEEL